MLNYGSKAQGWFNIIKYLLCILPPILNESPVARLVVVHMLFLSPLYYRVAGHVVLIHQMLIQLLNYIGLLDSENEKNIFISLKLIEKNVCH